LDFLGDLESQKTFKNNVNNKKDSLFDDFHQDFNLMEEKTRRPHKPLSLRPDVMNKNIFRAIRKQYKQLFNNFASSKKNFLLNIHKFSERLLSFTQIDWQKWEAFHRDDFTKYLGAFISPSKLKKQAK
jgi:hypothetical protein